MTDIAPSPLEAALLNEFHRLYGAVGFPAADSIGVTSRDNTGGSRYVALRCREPCALQSGYLDLGGKHIEMPHIPNGLMAVIRVVAGQPVELAIAVYGGDSWDGEEREWTLV